MTLEQLARENGVLYSDRTTPCIIKNLKDQDLVDDAIGALIRRATDRDNRKSHSDVSFCIDREIIRVLRPAILAARISRVFPTLLLQIRKTWSS